MPSIKEVKNRIGSVKSTQQLTKAMKMVAAAKLKKAQDKVLQLRPYSKKLNEILSNLSDSINNELFLKSKLMFENNSVANKSLNAVFKYSSLISLFL